ncbi:hypothetical protein MNBD_NITROSPINAE02-1910 [hydrothermal vent metagenome]|uniref:Cytochrome c domain-containing protein n=1 Tax=hydrothermal vent metagenome TaxID=652676 RepID=A0A3B1CFL5_9ZZZZ
MGGKSQIIPRRFLFFLIAAAVIVLTFSYYGMGMMGGMSGGMMGHMKLMRGWIAGDTLPVDFKTPRPAPDKGAIASGKSIYTDRCAICHGPKGDGKGEKAKDLIVQPRDFTFAVYKFRSTPSGSAPTDEDIYKTVSRGLHQTAMLPWIGLSATEKWQVTYYIKSFSDFFDEGEELVTVKAPEKRESGAEYVKKGELVYKNAKCGVCHGPDGRGDGEKADKLKDDWQRPIKPTDFRRTILKRGLNIEEIYLTIATGLNGTPMPSFSTALSPDDMLSVSYYIRSLAPKLSRGGMMMMGMNGDERTGMMTDMPGMRMGGGMMRNMMR